MKKNEKKIEHSIAKALTCVCETLKDETAGFSWVTHLVDYAHFPQSLKIVYVFETTQSLESAKNQGMIQTVLSLSKASLHEEGITIPRLESALFFDTEDNGADFNSPRWCRKYS